MSAARNRRLRRGRLASRRRTRKSEFLLAVRWYREYLREPYWRAVRNAAREYVAHWRMDRRHAHADFPRRHR